MRYKGIAAIILQAVIPEFSDMSLIEIARSIVNTRSRPKNQTATNILEDEIDFLPSESGTKDEKNTIQDASFRVRRKGVINTIDLRTLSKMSSMDTMYTTNLEMQNHTSHLGYSILSRAVYYAATLLRDTVPAGDTKYTNIHKVYTIWLCMENINDFEINFAETEGQYIHRYGMRRFYSNIADKVVKAEEKTDLMEVVIVELQKIKHLDSDSIGLLRNLFFNTPSVVEEIERKASVSLTKVRKGVSEMLDTELIAARSKEEGRAEGKAEGKKEAMFITAKQMLISTGAIKKSKEEAINIIKQYVQYPESIIERAYVELKNKN